MTEATQIIDRSLQKVVGGTGIAFLGTIIALLLALANRTLVARFFTQDEYGIYSLAIVIFNILVAIAILGLQGGTPRQIAFHRGNKDEAKVRGIIRSSIVIAAIASVILSVALFFASDAISTHIFNTPELAPALRIICIGIPFAVLLVIFTSIFRGFGRVAPRVYFNDILRNVLFLIALGLIVLLSYSFIGVIYAFAAAAGLACLGFVLYMIKKLPFSLRNSEGSKQVMRELLLFSLPLLGSSMLVLIIHWTDTLMLGYFKDSEVVGLYNGALPLAQVIPVTLTSMGFIYVPVAARLYSQGHTEELKRSYQVLTKWIFSLSLPVAMLLLLFPDTILSLFFGSEYAEAALALRLLSLGLLVHTFLGANGMSLLVFGRTRLVMWAGLIGASLNVLLNATLIPSLGITGAAIASMVSYFAINAFRSTMLYRISGIHPFTWNYLKPLIASGIVISIIYVIASNLLTVEYWMLPLFFILFLVIYGLCLLLTKSFDDEDIRLLLAIERRTGVDATPIKSILRKFV